MKSCGAHYTVYVVISHFAGILFGTEKHGQQLASHLGGSRGWWTTLQVTGNVSIPREGNYPEQYHRVFEKEA